MEELYKIRCPFCRFSVSATGDDHANKVCKQLFGRHLAKLHRGDMDLLARKRMERAKADLLASAGVFAVFGDASSDTSDKDYTHLESAHMNGGTQ